MEKGPGDDNRLGVLVKLYSSPTGMFTLLDNKHMVAPRHPRTRARKEMVKGYFPSVHETKIVHIRLLPL